jgi:transcriptional regulator with XRE-family HTH domain
MAQVKNKDLSRSIALTIKKLRAEKKLSQADLVVDLNINIGRIENASSNVSVATLEKICKYFDITLSRFFKEVEKNYKS